MVRAENMEQSSNLIRYEEVEDVVSSSSNIEGEQSKPTTDNKSRGKKKTKPNRREKEEEEGEEEETSEEEEEGVEEVEDEVEERRRLSRLKTKTKAVRITMGFFDHVANDNSRQLLRLKLQPLLQHLSLLRHMVQRELSGRGLVTGSTVLVMTVNTGEVDLLANFLCSLVSHHLAADVMQRIVVFTPSADVVPILHSLGVIGIHHSESFAYASDAANGEYLDRTFIDMMWYKSFSVWLLLSLGYHVLFQDVDIVWFRDPFRYFQQLSHRYFQRTLTTGHVREPDAILSDDGQRSIRYTPFYANSGFYFFRSNERMEAVAWSIVTAFDLLHISGSHQNIFTLRLLEGMDLSPAPGILTLFLPMNDFPSGVKYSHDRPYMRNIANDVEHPYIFHMCWTRNKYQKLENFRKAKMWYVREDASRCFDDLGNVNFSVSIDHPKRHKRGPKRQAISLLSSLLSESETALTSSISSLEASKALLKTIFYFEDRNTSYDVRWKAFQQLICKHPGE